MDFELTEDQRLLKESAAQFVERSPIARFRKLRSQGGHGTELVEHPLGWDPMVWRQMAELGWLGLFYPDDVGGLGLSFFDMSLVLEELSKTLVPEPLLASVVLAGGAVLRAASAEQRKRLLAPLVEGKTVLALAWAEKNGRYDVAHVETRARQDGSRYLLDGEKVWVLAGHAADVLIVSARTEAGLSLFAVPRDAPGLTVESLKTLDGQRAARVRLRSVSIPSEDLLGVDGGAEPALVAALDLAAAGACAEGCGIASTVLWMTVDYLRTRKQFGVPIGSFQALQHRAVDMFVETELLRSTAMLACVKADSDDVVERARAVSIAKANLARAGRFVVQQAIQLHGGIGITDEHDVGLFFKRMTALHALFGDEEHHLARYSSLPGFAPS